MIEQSLGRLERVELRNIWSSEASHFTPWLAREENLAVLGEALGLDLELEAQERPVGPFRADLLCKDIGSGAWVLVENQLEGTDHKHLGQLLTYASGLEAAVIVWIAGRFTEEHRSTLDWLNKITDESFRFFGLEVELWKIGNSPAAPKFNVVSKPNEWSKAVAQAARSIEEGELSTVQSLQRQYWSGLIEFLTTRPGPFAKERKAPAQSWIAFPIGRSWFNLAAVMIRRKSRLRVELYLAGNAAKNRLSALRLEREQIERDLGYPIEWEDLPDNRDCRASIYLDGVEAENRDDWRRQHEWLAAKLADFHRVFRERVRRLPGDPSNGDYANDPA